MKTEKPYSDQDYIEAELLGYDLDVWEDYDAYFSLGKSESGDNDNQI